jgi:hypothetical protein
MVSLPQGGELPDLFYEPQGRLSGVGNGPKFILLNSAGFHCPLAAADTKVLMLFSFPSA